MALEEYIFNLFFGGFVVKQKFSHEMFSPIKCHSCVKSVNSYRALVYLRGKMETGLTCQDHSPEG